MRLQRHHAKLQAGVPFVFQPRIALHARVKVIGTLRAILWQTRQTIVFHLFCETRTAMVPIHLRPQFCIAIDAKIEVELWFKHIIIAVFQHRPIHQPLVLCRMHTTAPVAVVGCDAIFGSLFHIFRIESKESAVEFCRPFATTVAP